MTASIRHLRRTDYVEMPWRNGQGSTLEIARDPPESTDFRWRLSLATIGASGPFSVYTGYRRSVSLVHGNGFVLKVDQREPMTLVATGATALFPGDANTACELIGGASTDLSLMVREPGSITSVVLETCDIVRSFATARDALQAFFCLDEGLVFALDDTLIPLARHDTIVLSTDGARCDFSTLRPASRLLRLVWSVG